VWLLASTVLLLGVIPCSIACLRGDDPAAAVAGLLTAGSVIAMTLLLLAVGFERSVYADVAVVVAALSFAGGLVFVRYLEAWR
jgi:multisubunit Na+/H+ antiporter MnhF subunit